MSKKISSRDNEDDESQKLREAIVALEHALTFKIRIAEDRFYFSGIAKAFEVCFEYAWKFFKQRAVREGFEVFSPREAIKLAGRLHLIVDVETWLSFLDDRNQAVHDYLGMPDDQYLATIESFAQEVRKL